MIALIALTIIAYSIGWFVTGWHYDEKENDPDWIWKASFWPIGFCRGAFTIELKKAWTTWNKNPKEKL